MALRHEEEHGRVARLRGNREHDLQEIPEEDLGVNLENETVRTYNLKALEDKIIESNRLQAQDLADVGYTNLLGYLKTMQDYQNLSLIFHEGVPSFVQLVMVPELLRPQALRILADTLFRQGVLLNPKGTPLSETTVWDRLFYKDGMLSFRIYTPERLP